MITPEKIDKLVGGVLLAVIVYGVAMIAYVYLVAPR